MGKVLLTLLVAAAFSTMPQGRSVDRPVRVAGGLVSGIPGRDASITVFKGLPFAAPPVGTLRWRPPQPVAAWQGVRKADTFAPSCMQTIVDERKPWTYEFMTHTEVSEDCLYLNVWTGATAPGEKRPVYVYVHGGANTEGSGAVPVYDGEGLARKGIVVVTVNYRLGVLGFLTHPELTKESGTGSSGNYALLDVVAALRWVRDHIAAFGGDPANVTLGGQSAGAANTHALTASPLARGLFHRAIAQSGSSIAPTFGVPRALADQEQLGVQFAQARGARTLADLRAMPWAELTTNPPAGGATPAPPGGFRFGPVVDGHVLKASVLDVFAAGQQNDVPTLTGANEHEGGATPNPDISLEVFQKQARQRFGELADEFLALYPAATDAEARVAQNESSWDQTRVSMFLWAAHRARTAKTDAYTYFWRHALPGPDVTKYGAFHTSEVPYVMNALAMSDRPFTPQDHRIADTLSSYWANFMRTGDPNGPGLPRWPAVTPHKAETMQVGDGYGPIPVASTPARLAFFEKHFARQRSAGTR